MLRIADKRAGQYNASFANRLQGKLVIARLKRAQMKTVFFEGGTEHGQAQTNISLLICKEPGSDIFNEHLEGMILDD